MAELTRINDYFLYLTCWVLFCLVACGILFRDRLKLVQEWRIYAKFLCMPWKLALFFPALLFVTVAGRYTNDETWDVVSGAGMSILTFVTAPWCVGLLYQAAKGKRPVRYVIVALALCLFSSSWFYDGYLLVRDGHYTTRWWSNLMLSPIIYLSAGLLWNLEAKGDFSSTFSFFRIDWPEPPANRKILPLIPLMLPLIGIAIYLLVGFVGWHR